MGKDFDLISSPLACIQKPRVLLVVPASNNLPKFDLIPCLLYPLRISRQWFHWLGIDLQSGSWAAPPSFVALMPRKGTLRVYLFKEWPLNTKIFQFVYGHALCLLGQSVQTPLDIDFIQWRNSLVDLQLQKSLLPMICEGCGFRQIVDLLFFLPEPESRLVLLFVPTISYRRTKNIPLACDKDVLSSWNHYLYAILNYPHRGLELEQP